MGVLKSSCTFGVVPCCADNRVAKILCGNVACCGTRQSVTTRLIHSAILLIILGTAWILNSAWLAKVLNENVPEMVEKFCYGDISLVGEELRENKCYGPMVVHRISLGAVMYHGTLSLLLAMVRNTCDPRAVLQNGFWLLKVPILASIIVGVFYIPSPHIAHYSVVSYAGAFLFVVYITVVLIDFVFKLADTCKSRSDENSIWEFYLAATTFFGYGGAVIFTTLSFYFYTGRSNGEPCRWNQTAIAFNIVLIAVAVVVSCLPKVQDRVPNSGVMQPAILALVTSFLIYSAFSFLPKEYETSCSTMYNKNVLILWDPDSTNITEGVIENYEYLINDANDNGSSTKYFSNDTRAGEAATFIGMLFAVAALVIAPFTSGSSEHAFGWSYNLNDDINVDDEEADEVLYSYSMCHVSLLCAAMYGAMTITEWTHLEADHTAVVLGINGDFKAVSGIPGVFVQLAASWIVHLLFLALLLMPLCFPDTRFRYTSD